MTQEPQNETTEVKEDLSNIEPTNNGKHLPVVARNLTKIPDLHARFGGGIESVDLSFNEITAIENLEKFTKLKSLVLDNNMFEDIDTLPSFPHLETLWLNGNNIKDVEKVINVIESKCPNLTYLSLLKNPACPNEFTGNDLNDYQRHRFYVLWRLKKLKFLDSRQVTPAERSEAAKRGPFCKVKKVEATETNPTPQTFEAVDTKAILEQQAKKEGSQSFYGVTRQVYTGKHSEGNRFIRNNDL